MLLSNKGNARQACTLLQPRVRAALVPGVFPHGVQRGPREKICAIFATRRFPALVATEHLARSHTALQGAVGRAGCAQRVVGGLALLKRWAHCSRVDRVIAFDAVCSVCCFDSFMMDDLATNSLLLAVGLLALVFLPQLLFSAPVATHELRAQQSKKAD